jgi:hypothetical protein
MTNYRQPGRSPVPAKGRLSLYATIGIAVIVIALLVIFVF